MKDKSIQQEWDEDKLEVMLVLMDLKTAFDDYFYGDAEEVEEVDYAEAG